MNEASQTVAPGATATFDYAVAVTHDGSTDAWATTGTVRVSNPNDWEPITADVTDAVDNGGVCTVTGGAGVSIPARDSVDLPYTCTYCVGTEPPGRRQRGDAHVEPGDGRHSRRLGSDDAPADFSTVSPTIADGSVAVTDTLGGMLGTASLQRSEPERRLPTSTASAAIRPAPARATRTPRPSPPTPPVRRAPTAARSRSA